MLRPAQETALRTSVQDFVRRFGLLNDNETPCGQPLPLSHAHALLVLLERESSGVTLQKDLVGALRLDKSNVARLCVRMEAAGHVSQRQSPADGRAREIALTAKGLRVAKNVEEASRSRFERILAAIPSSERTSVVDALAVLNRAVEALDQRRSP